MITENIFQVRAIIEAACARAARKSESVTLIAVSKTHPADYVLAAIEAGVQHFGENRVEEAEPKIAVVHQHLAQNAVEVPVMWHMVGHVQSRKAKLAAPLFDAVHSVDSVKLARKLSEARAEDAGATPLNILLEMNVSGEESKEGFAAAEWNTDRTAFDALYNAAREIQALSGLRLCGVMTVAPIVDTMEAVRPYFVALRGLRDVLSERLAHPLPELSMGMTDDYPVAVEEGATMVRVGRAIFGAREHV